MMVKLEIEGPERGRETYTHTHTHTHTHLPLISEQWTSVISLRMVKSLMHACIHTHTHACIHTRMHTHIHTHTGLKRN